MNTFLTVPDGAIIFAIIAMMLALIFGILGRIFLLGKMAMIGVLVFWVIGRGKFSMKSIACFVVGMFLIGTSLSLHAQGFVWTDRIGISNPPAGDKIATDSSGNIFITGGFHGTAYFGKTNLTSGGNIDIFLAKYDPTGNLVWVRQATGTNNFQSAGQDVCTDTNGNVFITGTFQGSVDFGSISMTANGSLSTGPVNNQFIAEYDGSGNLVQVTKTGASGGGGGLGIAVDSHGYIYTTGYVENFNDQQSLVVDKWNWAHSGSSVWHLQYDQPPNYFWPMQGHSIKVDVSGNIYVTGTFGVTVTFGTNTLSTIGNFGTCPFMVKFDGNGNVLWAHQPVYFGPSTAEVGNSTCLDRSGNVIFAGNYAETNIFGGTTLTTLNSEIVDGYVAKCDANGNYLWAVQMPAVEGSCSAVATDNNGNVYVTGSLYPSQTFLNKYDPNGNLVWQLMPSGGKTSSGYSVAVDSSNHVSLASWTTGSISFDSQTFTNLAGNDVFVSLGGEDIPPVFVNQPTSSAAGLLVGMTNTFVSTTRSLTPVTYQWQFMGTNIFGATNASLIIPNVQVTNAGPYQVIAGNIYGNSTSSLATLTIYFPVTLIASGTGGISNGPGGAVAQPGSRLCYSNNSTITLTALPTAPNAFLGWSGDVTTTANPLTIPVTTNLYIVADFSDEATNIIVDNPDRRAMFTGAWSLQPFSSFGQLQYGSNFEYAVCSTDLTATAVYRPTITIPGYYDVTIWTPRYAAQKPFSARAPWTVVCNSTTLTTNVNEQSSGGAWRLLASSCYFNAGINGFVSLGNNSGESSTFVVVADAVRLFPSQPPMITSNPLSQTVKTGANVTFSVAVSGSAPFGCQWSFNGTNLAEATRSSLSLTRVQPANAGNYSVSITNLLGSVSSSNAILTVLPPSPPTFSSPGINQGGQFQVNLTSDPGVTFSILTSTNLVDWTTLTNLLNASGSVAFIDSVNTNMSFGPRFYLAIWQPQ